MTSFSAFAAPAVTVVTDAEGMLALRDDPAGSYRLDADIDMGGLDWKPLSFRGSFDGNGHTLYNLTVTSCGDEVRTTRDGNLKPYDTVFAGLFSTLENAEVKDLTLRGEHVAVETTSHCFAAGLAGYIDRSTVSGCTIEARISLINSGIMTGIGGIAGYGCGTICDCVTDTELVFEDRNTAARCEQFMGGILACGLADVDRNDVTVRGYDSCRGYVHDGGLIGMYYHCGMEEASGDSVCDNVITGFIRFFEDNPDRRAYCGPSFGEYLQMPSYFHGNIDRFERQETWDYGTILSPEGCEAPELQRTVTPSGCSSWGFTEVTCANCGYSYVENWTPPAHSPGEWETLREPSYSRPGTERLRCTVCRETLEEREIPALIASQSCSLDRETASLLIGETFPLQAEVEPAEALGRALIWSSSDPAVATVDSSG
ncbi:MAG: Ig-like domain-containing protein, partial [Oscillospiraceae bacterium]|nr:Ig-like domain-containing protein [Oscillospiraceae bacterium]